MIKKEVIVQRDPKSPISEIFRTLRTNIQFMNSSKKLKTLLVTSTYPGEGKSWVTTNLAVTFAQTGKKVILVDADMRKGRQYAMLGVSPKPGLSNYLSGVNIDDEEIELDLANYIQDTSVENLYVMVAGNVPPNPSELLVSTHMVDLLEQLKSICDVIIIDGTPCELVTDSVILSRIVDSTIVVTAHNQTKKDAVERVIKNIQNVGGKLAGVVINKMPIKSKAYNEKYYYYDSVTPSKNLNKKHITPRTPEGIKRNPPRNLDIPSPKKTINKRNIDIDIGENETLENNIHIDKTKNITDDRTNDILKQINEYLENEKSDEK